MIHQIILSCNEDPMYREFWEPVSWAYRRMLPDVVVHLAFLTKRGEDDELVLEMRKHGKVTLFPPVHDVPEFGQAKMIRFILASQQGDDVCYVDDIDLFPLKRSFITDKTNQRPAGHLLCVGGEVYRHNGCYPVSQMTAEGHVWKRFINPKDLAYDELLDGWKFNYKFDEREDIMTITDFDNDSYFSDERLIRRLTHYNPVPKFELERGYRHFMEATVDRYDWKIDAEKLKNHGYENAHGIRPYSRHSEKYAPLIGYIEENYPALSGKIADRR